MERERERKRERERENLTLLPAAGTCKQNPLLMIKNIEPRMLQDHESIQLVELNGLAAAGTRGRRMDRLRPVQLVELNGEAGRLSCLRHNILNPGCFKTMNPFNSSGCGRYLRAPHLHSIHQRVIDSGLVVGYHAGRRCLRDTYPESYITKYTIMRRKNSGAQRPPFSWSPKRSSGSSLRSTRD